MATDDAELMDLIVGGSSRVAQRFMALSPDRDFIVADRPEITRWLAGDDASEFSRFVDGAATGVKHVHIFAAVTDPQADPELIESVNVRLPRLVLERANDAGYHVTTYGSALEALGPTTNRYLESKRRVASMVDEFARNGTDAFHIRFHTVYGTGTPQPHMFLGQIFTALVTNSSFNMTSGEQLREYHHVDDVVTAITLLNAHRTGSSATISHGMPVRLRDLATAIFASLDRSNLLNIGTVQSEQTDVYDSLGGETLELEGLHFREPIAGVVDCIRQALAAATQDN
jgi:nucleoside-diphosphate-sugar epimerase